MTSSIFNAEFRSLLVVTTVLYTRHQRLLIRRQNEGSLIWIHRNLFKWTTIVEYCMRLRDWVQNITQREKDQIKVCQISSLQSLFMRVGWHSKNAHQLNMTPVQVIPDNHRSSTDKERESWRNRGFGRENYKHADVWGNIQLSLFTTTNWLVNQEEINITAH